MVPPLSTPEERQVAGGAEFESPGALCAGYRYGPRKAVFDLSGRCALHLLELSLDAVELTLPHVFIIGGHEGLSLGDGAQPQFGLPNSRIGRSEHAEIPGLIPTDAARCAISGILAHECDAGLCGALLHHRPAARNQAIHAPVTQIVPIGQSDDRFCMSSDARDIAQQFVQAGAGKVVDVRGEVRLIQLSRAAERLFTRTTRLVG